MKRTMILCAVCALFFVGCSLTAEQAQKPYVGIYEATLINRVDNAPAATILVDVKSVENGYISYSVDVVFDSSGIMFNYIPMDCTEKNIKIKLTNNKLSFARRTKLLESGHGATKTGQPFKGTGPQHGEKDDYKYTFGFGFIDRLGELASTTEITPTEDTMSLALGIQYKQKQTCTHPKTYKQEAMPVSAYLHALRKRA